jgi:hypothetical protein
MFRKFLLLFAIIKTLNGAQNEAPRFYPPLQTNYFFPEYNQTRPGQILLWLNATDADDDDLRFGVEGDFYRKLLDIRKIDHKHAVVTSKQIFDREVIFLNIDDFTHLSLTFKNNFVDQFFYFSRSKKNTIISFFMCKTSLVIKCINRLDL